MAGPLQTRVELPELTPAQQAQLKSLETELRCLVCQNQTLAESSAELAGDLRNLVHKLVASGKSDAEIKTYLTERYGDFVLYKPPFKPQTALLWIGPFLLLALGVLSWFIIGRRQERMREARAPASNNAIDSNASDANTSDPDAAKKRAAELLRK